MSVHRLTSHVDDYFGGCPICRKNDGFLNVGSEHWFVCHKHRTKWCIGSSLFTSWREESEDDWRANRYRLATYRMVEPALPKVEGER